MNPAPDSACKLLVVDDDQDLREVIASILGLFHFDVATAANGADALAKLRGGLRPRLILLDLMMPVMDGWEFRAAQLKEPDLRAIPVLVITAAHQHLEDGAALQATGFLRKPMELDDLVAMVQRLCLLPAPPSAPPPKSGKSA